MSIQDPENPFPVFDALHIPPLALERGGTEVLRAVVIDGDLHISVRRAFDDPESWGMLLADVARDIGRLYASESAMSEHDILERLREAFETELDEPSDPDPPASVS